MNIVNYIHNATQLSKVAIEKTLTLFDEACTIPFIARYRKEVTGNLDEVELSQILKNKTEFEALIKRKKVIIKAVKEQGLLTSEIEDKIATFTNINDLEDFYLPYKKKRSTKAEIAKKNGLEPLAKMIMSQNITNFNATVNRFINLEIDTVEKALEGAKHIMAMWINERSDIRNSLRQQLKNKAVISAKVVKKIENDENALKFKDYFSYQELLNKIPSHRLLAILRAENLGFIKVNLQVDQEDIIKGISKRIIKSNNQCAEQIEKAILYSYKNHLFPSLSKEALNLAKEKADDKAIAIFAKNLKQLLLAPPLGEKNILAIDPGYRSGCKIVCLNKQGDLVHNETIYPHPPQKELIKASKKITTLVSAYKIDAIAIGNGTASRETEYFIKKLRFNSDLQVFIVNEAGASIYSASKIARDEFPNYDVTVRGAVSIGRRLADPLAELVKIDPKAIGVGQYQHDVNQAKLKEALDSVVESCVNNVGVNVNTASVQLLSYVSGIGNSIAENIVDYREKNGALTNRNQLKEIPRLGAKAFEQSAGFLRIKNGENPLDNSAVHPESYAIVSKMAKSIRTKIYELIANENLIDKIEVSKFITNEVGLPTLNDIINELKKPGIDPREKAKVFTFNKNIKSINDLREGQLLPGIVNNITNFGCFVDIGIKESGLVHISNLTNKFVSDVTEVVSLHQQVIVKVLEVDIPRKRIQLSMNYK